MKRWSSEYRLRVPVGHDYFEVFRFESFCPCFIRRSARSAGGFVFDAEAGGDEDGAFVIGAIQKSLQREASTEGVAEEGVAAIGDGVERRRLDCETGIAKEVPIARIAEKAVQAGDHHSASYLAQARRLASPPGRSSVTRSAIPHTAAH